MLYNVYPDMSEIYERRRLRLRQLIEERFDGYQLRLANAGKISSSQISRVLRGLSTLGDYAAHEIEMALGLGHGWLNRAPPAGAAPDTPYKARKGRPPRAGRPVDAKALQRILSAGLNQSEAAKLLGVHKSTVSRHVRHAPY